MVQFGKIIGSKGEFSATLETKLQNFQEGSDYYIYNEASGRVRKKHYVICSERPVENLRKINWKDLKGFKSIEVGEIRGSGFDDEPMKFVVESLADEWVSYQTDKPSPQNSVSSSSNSLLIPRDMAERRDEMNKRKAEMEKRKVEFESKLRNQGLSYGSYGYSQKFEGGSVEKFCPNCKVNKEVSLDDNFCSDCGKKLELSSKIKEIDEHSYSHETSRKNNNRKGGSGGSFGNAVVWGSLGVISLISLVFPPK